MKPEDLVPSRETCIALKEAGFPQDTFFCWGDEYDEPRIYRTDGCCGDWINPDDVLAAAPTLGEILEQLPQSKLFEPEGERQVRAGYLTLEKCAKYEIGFFSGTIRFPLAFEAHEKPAEAAARLWIKVGKEDGCEG